MTQTEFDVHRRFPLKSHATDAGTRFVTDPGAFLVAQTRTDLPADLFEALAEIDPEFAALADDYETLDYVGPAASGKHAANTLLQLAGQLCYLAIGKRRTLFRQARDYLAKIMTERHGSVLEHASASFVFMGVSRAMTHELVRHRAGTAYCLAGDTLIYSERCHGGRRNGPKRRRLDAIYAMTKTPHGRSRLKLLKLRCLDETSGTFVTGRVRAVVESGVKQVFRVILADGKTITCTKDHRFLTPTGWKPLKEIAGGLALTPSGIALHGELDTPVLVNGLPAYQSREWLHEHYVNNDLTQEQMGALAGVTHHCIRKWIRHHGLQKPLGAGTQGVAPWNKGRRYTIGPVHTDAHKALFAEQKRGEKNPQWRGGVSRERQMITADVARMRSAIYARDRYTCRLCGTPGGKLTLHHILPVWSRPDLARDPDNLATVCRPCHVDRLNGHELDFVEALGRRVEEVGRVTAPRARRVLRPHPVAIRRIEYAGEQMTYDIEMDGANHNFVANGVVTHNSQVSQRYVGPEHVRFVLPYEDAQSERLRERFRRDIDTNYGQYVDRIAILHEEYPRLDGEHERDYRKRIQSSGRSVLGNYVEAPIVMTANYRAWLHVFAMRCGKYADVNIRRPMCLALRKMIEVSPEVFDHFEESTLPDGSPCATPRFEKP